MTAKQAFAAGFAAGTVGLEPQEITALIAGYYGFDFATLTGEERTHRISQARKAAVWAVRKFTRTRPVNIANLFSQDRAIIYHAWQEFELSPDPNVRREADEITGLIKAKVQELYDEEIPF